MTDEDTDTAGVIAPPPLIYAVPLVVGLVLNAVRPVAVAPRALARVGGLALIGAAVAVGVAAFAALRTAGTPPDPRKPTTTIVVAGPYRVSRNPIYLAFTLLYAGVAVFANALWAAVLLPGVLLVMQRGVIEREERYLERRFGDEYRRYKARVRRWV
jgi:protein-S-isoprenylcysteine O-methyltransferase Ste14